jgi:hypothetical protein
MSGEASFGRYDRSPLEQELPMHPLRDDDSLALDQLGIDGLDGAADGEPRLQWIVSRDSVLPHLVHQEQTALSRNDLAAQFGLRTSIAACRD